MSRRRRGLPLGQQLIELAVREIRPLRVELELVEGVDEDGEDGEPETEEPLGDRDEGVPALRRCPFSAALF